MKIRTIRQQAQKRGGGQRTLSLNVDDAEARLAREPSHDWTPARVFEREWAIALLDRVLEMLRREYVERGKGDLFLHLKGFLLGEDSGNYEAVAATTGTTMGALRVTVYRLRQRYGELLRQEIGHTVSNQEELNDECRSLLEALRGE